MSGPGRDVLVTGTDTGVGKTVVAAAVVLARRAAGVDCVGFKPVETGISADQPADWEILAEASGARLPLAEPLLRLEEPLAPALAAQRAGVSLAPADIESRIRQLRAAGHRLVVEGAGGLLVPLAWEYTALDLAAAVGLAVVVVARAGLGTLNHTLLTLRALEARGVPVCGVVLDGMPAEPDLAERTNPASLARLCPGVPIRVLPRTAGTSLEIARAVAPRLQGLA